MKTESEKNMRENPLSFRRRLDGGGTMKKCGKARSAMQYATSSSVNSYFTNRYRWMLNTWGGGGRVMVMVENCSETMCPAESFRSDERMRGLSRFFRLFCCLGAMLVTHAPCFGYVSFFRGLMIVLTLGPPPFWR